MTNRACLLVIIVEFLEKLIFASIPMVSFFVLFFFLFFAIFSFCVCLFVCLVFDNNIFGISHFFVLHLGYSFADLASGQNFSQEFYQAYVGSPCTQLYGKKSWSL